MLRAEALLELLDDSVLYLKILSEFILFTFYLGSTFFTPQILCTGNCFSSMPPHHQNCSNFPFRDIKGSNVLVDTDGCCKLADFGCSKSLCNVVDMSPSFKGTMRFMAPEVINGIDHGKPADVWALGCTIIEMLTARHPWAQFELPESAMYHVGSLKATPPIPSHASPDIQDFLQCCFSSEPLERWTVRIHLFFLAMNHNL
jgi:serine/threonine protein kinase